MRGWIPAGLQQVGLLLEHLRQTGLAENTIVVYSADHGDYAGDYGLVEKWPSGLEDVLTRWGMNPSV